MSDSGIRIDLAPVGVSEYLARLHDACFEPLPETPWSAHAFRILLSQPTTRALIARPNAEEIGGLLVGRIAGDEAEILTLCVVPSARRSGIAGALFARFFTMLAPEVRTTLEVAVNNAAAIALYRSLGFVEVGRRPNYYGGLTRFRGPGLGIEANPP